MKKLFAIISMLLFLAIPLTYASAAQIDEIKAAIAQKGASWAAEENEFSALPAAEKKKMLGALPFEGLPPGHQTLTPAEVPENMKLHSTVTPVGTNPFTQWDWRNSCDTVDYPRKKGCCIPGLNYDVPPVCGNFVTAPKNQKDCGSCWAFSSTGALESQFLIKYLMPGKNLNLSEQILISCMPGSTYTGDTGCGGGYTTDAAQFFYDSGTGLESCYPYKALDPSESSWTCNKACVNYSFLPYGLTNWNSENSPSLTSIKSMIMNYGPVVVTFGVYDDFYYYKKGVYQYTWGIFEGGHAVEVVGWHDDASNPAWGGGYFTVKNSWGGGWGMSGYFNIAYSELNSLGGTTQFGYWGNNPTVYYYGAEPVTLTIKSPDKGKEVCHTGNSCTVVFDAPPWNTYTFAVWYKVGSGKWTLLDQWDGPGSIGLFESFTAPAVTKKTPAYFKVIQYYPADTTYVAAKVTSPVFFIEP